MVAALKLLALPSLFILPWLCVKIGNGEEFIRELLASQPLWGIAALLPGFLLFVFWMVNQLKS